MRKLQLINLTSYTTLQYVACTFLDLCSQIVSKMRKLFFMTDKSPLAGNGINLKIFFPKWVIWS